MSSPTLLITDGPGGPTPSWYLPRLCPHYDVHVLWHHGPDPAVNAQRERVFDAWCTHTVVPEGAELTDFTVEYAKQHAADGIVAFSEIPVVAAHTAAAALSLPGNPPESLPALRNKLQQRSRLQAAGVPVPRFAEVRTAEEFRQARRTVGLPAVLKPVVGAGSMATHAVDAEDEADEIWARACEAYLNDPRGGTRPAFILEQRLIGSSWYPDTRYGDHISVESLVRRGEISHLAVTDKFPLSPPFRENGGMLPSVLPPDRIREIEARTTAAIRALGLTNSAVHTEFKLTAAGPMVIEVNCRIGGGATEMLHHSAGYDFVRATAAVATGGPLPAAPEPHRYAGRLIPQPPDHAVVLTRVPTAPEVLAVSGAQEVVLPHRAGARLSPERGSTNYLAAAIAVADHPEHLLDCFDRLTAPGLFAFTPSEERATG
ncbi:acetyl-CoA carboxylase biotin carboxylase subunit family protein [Streptomyces sp. NPDC050161]|uniref:acetyl-CoA carboxylase biotin carboxylase subunit family protein n=1 Tax=Streptomyces sp. NPDC050161 TaxID=3365604 RepID=UPI00378AA677